MMKKYQQFRLVSNVNVRESQWAVQEIIILQEVFCVLLYWDTANDTFVLCKCTDIETSIWRCDKYILGYQLLYQLLFEFPFVGLWFDLEISYSGSFLMTLETKMNLTRLGKEGEGLGEQGKEG